MGIDAHAEIRRFWDRDAAIYDDAHDPATALERAAWVAALRRLLPPLPARILDVGAGTGFVSLPAARLGYDVTAVDLAPAMLARLNDKASRELLSITTIEGRAEDVADPYDAIIEHHVMWTVPNPGYVLQRWRETAPNARLVLLESGWGRAATRMHTVRSRVDQAVRRMRRIPNHHHSSYSAELNAALPLGSGVTAERLAELVSSSGWEATRVERLRDVEWAMLQARSGLARIPQVPAQYAVSAG